MAYYIRYDEHRDQWCIVYFVGRDIKIHSTYNTLVCAKQYAEKLNQAVPTNN